MSNKTQTAPDASGIAGVSVVCREASGTLVPSCIRGYFCRACGIELQVSPFGQERIAAGATPYCNPCGIAIARRQQKSGAQIEMVEGPLATPALDQILGRNQPTPASPPKLDCSGTLMEHKSTSVEMLPSGKFQVSDIYGANHPDRPLYAVCDCCCQQADRIFLYRQRGFCVWPRRQGKSYLELGEGGWGFCVYCHALYVAGRIDLLVARVVTVGETMDSGAVAWFSHWYPMLPFFLHGEVTEWHSGQVLPKAKP